ASTPPLQAPLPRADRRGLPHRIAGVDRAQTHVRPDRPTATNPPASNGSREELGRADRLAHTPADTREPSQPMSRRAAALGSAAFFALAPGIVAGVVPWLLTHWHTQHEYALSLRLAGAALLAAGSVALASAFVRFVIDGIGTPAPVAPTRNLVVN